LLLLLSLIALLGSTTPGGAIRVWIVFFDADSSSLSEEATAVIAEAVNAARSDGVKSALITGHADTSETNLNGISLRRAEALRDKMRSLGVSSSFPIDVQARGADEPMTLDRSADGRAMNRRAVIEFAPDCDKYPNIMGCLRLPPPPQPATPAAPSSK
jgi:outer membrane protein OmpA-like peptidoglycan-associated protein